MRRIDGLSLAQRIIVVIALGMALAIVGGFLDTLGGGFTGGWFAYAPLTRGTYFPGAGPPPWVRLIIWLLLTGIWALASIRVLRPGREGTVSGDRAREDTAG